MVWCEYTPGRWGKCYNPEGERLANSIITDGSRVTQLPLKGTNNLIGMSGSCRPAN